MTRRARTARGQATVELAILIPVVVLLLAALVQMALVARDQVRVVRVTAATARAVMVEPDPRTAEVTADAVRGELDVERVSLHGGRGPGDLLTVSVVARPQRLPLLGAVVSGVRLRERLTVRVEG